MSYQASARSRSESSLMQFSLVLLFSALAYAYAMFELRNDGTTFSFMTTFFVFVVGTLFALWAYFTKRKFWPEQHGNFATIVGLFYLITIVMVSLSA